MAKTYRDTYWDDILGQHYILNDGIKLCKIIDELNNFMNRNGSITYYQYYEILSKYADALHYPGIMLDIRDWKIPIKLFSISCCRGYSDPNFQHEVDSWSIKPIK